MSGRRSIARPHRHVPRAALEGAAPGPTGRPGAAVPPASALRAAAASSADAGHADTLDQSPTTRPRRPGRPRHAAPVDLSQAATRQTAATRVASIVPGSGFANVRGPLNPNAPPPRRSRLSRSVEGAPLRGVDSRRTPLLCRPQQVTPQHQCPGRPQKGRHPLPPRQTQPRSAVQRRGPRPQYVREAVGGADRHLPVPSLANGGGRQASRGASGAFPAHGCPCRVR